MNSLFSDKFFYHIYPLGLCGCPERNDFSCPAGNAFQKLTAELPKIKKLGVNALYIGPVFESTAHGYDTVDYYHIDRRLGNNQTFSDFCRECHKLGISVILDAVFNHTGRDFFAFKDIQKNRENSPYKNWYKNLNFYGHSCYGDSFDYEGWAGCKDLVKLDVDNPQVREHLFGAVDFWIDQFKIDGLRLDAADALSKDFLDALSHHCKNKKNDFWLMGEVVHGDYNDWARPGRLDSVTNYQLYKALWSSMNDKNMFELSYNLNREFGNGGIYNYSPLYTFLDNHDVNRIASTVSRIEHLYLLYALMFCIPGIPSIYYGSEEGLCGTRNNSGDRELRPTLPPFSGNIPNYAAPRNGAHDLAKLIPEFASIRNNNAALKQGNYRQIFVSNELFAFSRSFEGQEIIIAVNCSEKKQKITLNGADCSRGYHSLLNEEKLSPWENQLEVPANWLCIYKKN